MRNRHTITRTAAVTASAFLAFALAACSGGEDGGSETGAASEESPAAEAEGSDDVCGATEALTDMSTAMSDIDPSDLQATMDKLEELTATLEAVDQPPAEVADDWNSLSSSFREITDNLGAVVDDPSDSEAMSKVSESMAALSDESFKNSARAVSTYAAENC